ncbi:hypothetical protein FRB99_003948 [Tulasnella sp. 403]|nr:hypothetical protein FRB99_003948 [Tulasnella sp. 403]
MSRNLYARPRAILPYNSNPPPSVSQSDGRRFIVQSNPGVLLMPFWDDEAILTYGPSDTLVSLNINFPSNRSDEHDSADQRKLNATQTQLRNIDKQTRTDREIWTKWFTDCPYLPRHLMPRPRPLRLLSLDGGGVRGIVSLIMLQRIMDRIAPGCKPCEYFDLIGGTSTGGLIAMMLGRLRMTTAECIVAYKHLAKEVFDVYPMKQWLTMLHAHRFRKMEPVFRRLEGIGDVLAFPQKLVDIATNCEDTHKTISDQQAKLHRHHRFYFRFNPDLKSKVKLDEWKRLGELEDVTRVYLENGPACEKLRHLANRLGG